MKHAVVARSLWAGDNGPAMSETSRTLAASIVLQAVEDWVDLIRAEARSGKPHDKEPAPLPVRVRRSDGRPWKVRNNALIPVSYDEIRDFFGSAYGEMICGIIGMETGVIIGKMERWLKAYRYRGELPNVIFRKGAD